VFLHVGHSSFLGFHEGSGVVEEREVAELADASDMVDVTDDDLLVVDGDGAGAVAGVAVAFLLAGFGGLS